MDESHGASLAPPSTSTRRNAVPFSSTGPSGHRGRMRERVLAHGASPLADYEILEMLLFLGIPRRDTKPLAKSLINRFGSLESVLTASPARLREAGLVDSAIAPLRLPALAAGRLARAEARARPELGNWEKLLAYFDTALAGGVPGQLRVLFLDNRNRLLADEAIEPKPGVKHMVAEILRRALALHATALIAVRLCAEGQAAQQAAMADVALAKAIAESSALLAVTLHDHMALRGGDWASLKQLGKI